MKASLPYRIWNATDLDASANMTANLHIDLLDSTQKALKSTTTVHYTTLE